MSAAYDRSGNAHLAWSAEDPGNVRTSHFRVGEGWTAIETLGAGTMPEVAVEPEGRAILVWVPANPSEGALAASHFDTAWAETVFVAPVLTGAAETPRVVSDAHGNGLTVWAQGDVDAADVWWNRYALGSWQGSNRLDTAGGRADQPEIAMNGLGAAVAVWRQAEGSSHVIYARVFE